MYNKPVNKGWGERNNNYLIQKKVKKKRKRNKTHGSNKTNHKVANLKPNILVITLKEQ